MRYYIDTGCVGDPRLVEVSEARFSAAARDHDVDGADSAATIDYHQGDAACGHFLILRKKRS